MFRKRSKTKPAAELFDQAREQWQWRKHFIATGNDKGDRNACTKIIRLCQLAIENDSQIGDIYVLLANTLLSVAAHFSKSTDQEQYEFLWFRGAAVIHLWHSLSRGGYLVTKNPDSGEKLWRTTIDQLAENKGISESRAVALLNSCRDSLANRAITPTSFHELQDMIARGDRGEGRPKRRYVIP